MKTNKTKAELLAELAEAKRQITELETARAQAARGQFSQAVAHPQTRPDSAAWFSHLFHANPAPQLIVTAGDGRIVDANAVFCEHTGYTREAIVGRTTREVNLWTEPAKLQTLIPQLQAGKPARNLELAFRNKDGEVRTVLFSFEPFELDGVKCLLSTGIDITERKQTEKALRESEERFRSFIEQSADGFMLSDEQGNIIEWNPAFARITGLPRAQALTMTVWEARHLLAQPDKRSPLDFEQLRENLTGLLHDDQSPYFHRANETEILTPHGHRKVIQQIAFPIPTASGHRIGAVVRDITGRKRMEAARQAEAVRRRILFDEAPDSILILDPQTRGFIEFNTAAHTQLGYTREEFAALRIYDIEAQETAEETDRHIRKVLETGKVDYETLHRTRQGELRHVHVTAQNVEILGHPVYYCTWRDVTARKRAEAARQESEERYHLLFETMAQGVIFLDREGQFIEANPAAERILGVTVPRLRESTIRDSQWQTIHEDGTPFALNAFPGIAAAQTGQAVHDVVMGVMHPITQTYRWINIHAIPRFLEGDSEPYQVYVTFDDITERKEAERFLLEKVKLQEQFEKTASIVPGMIHVLMQDPSGRMRMPYTSSSIADIYGFQPGEVAEDMSPIYNRFDARDLPMLDASVAESARTMAPWRAEYRYHHPQKGLRWLSGHSTPVRETDGSILWYGMIDDITERKQAEERLRESEQKYRELINNMNDTVWVIDFDTSILDVNHAATAILGYTREEMLSMKVSELDTALTPKQIQNLANTMPQDKVQVFETLHTTKQGQKIPVEVSSSLVIYDGRTVIMSIARDITEREQAEKALRENEERYRALIEYAPDGIVLIDADGKFKYTSPSVERIFGYTKEDLPTYDALAMTHPEDQARVLQELAALLEDPGYVPTLQYRFLHKNGEWRWIESTFSNLLAYPSVTAIIINFRDIHERKLAEEALNKSQALLTEAQRIGRIGHLEWNGRDEELICSAEVYEILELPPNSIITQKVMLQMMTPDERSRVQQLDFQAIGKRSDMNYEYRIQMSDGRERWIHHVGRVRYDAQGTPIRMMAIIQDVTERKKNEEFLRDSRFQIEMALKGANAAMWDWHIKTGATTFNDRWAGIVGYTLEELAPISIQTWIDLCHPDDLARSNTLLQKHFAGETEYYECEARMKHKNGTWVWVIDRGRVMEWDAEGQPIRMFGTHLDITDRKREERYLQARLTLINLSYEVSDMETLMQHTLDEAEALTNSTIGFFHFVDDDQNTINLQTWSTNTLNTLCKAEGKGLHYPVEQAGVWADGIRDGEPRIYNDYLNLPNRGKLPEGHALVHRLISLPIKRNNLVVAAIGIGNKPQDYNERDLFYLRRLAEDAFDAIQRKRTEQALRASEEKYRGLMESLSNAISVVDIDGMFIYMNDMAAEKLGGKPQDLIGTHIQDVIPEPIAFFQLTHIRNVFNRDHESVFESLGMANNGLRWYRFSLQPLHDESGNVVQVLINATDIHELKTTQQELMELNLTLEERVHERTAEVQDLYDNSPTGYHSLDLDGKFAAINQTELNWLGGYTREEVLGHSFTEFITEQSVLTFQQNFPIFKEVGIINNLEFEMKRKDGTTFPVLVNGIAIFDGEGNYLRSRSTMFNNTERKKAETALQESEATYRALFENSNDGIFLVSPTGRQLRANQRALNMLGYTIEDFQTTVVKLDKPFTIEPDQRKDSDEKLSALLRGEDIPLYERVFTAKDGHKVPVEVNLSPIRDETGKIIMVQSVVRDISQRKQAEEAMRNANLEMGRALRLKDEFLANMSHELRTPLNSILGMAEALLEGIRGPLNERQEKMVNIIEQSGYHLLSLINDILDLSKIEAGKLEVHLEPIPLTDVCQASLAFIKQPALKKGLSIEYIPDPRVEIIQADMRRLKQILVNLLNNAVKFTPSPGKITLQVEGNEQAGTVKLSVIDTGIGIAPEDLKRLFQPFTQVDSSLTRQYEGTGLGLALVRELTELHGGRVHVTSKIGQGSTFSVSIPWHPTVVTQKSHAEAVAPTPPAPTQTGNLASILLADDVQSNTLALGDYLDLLGYYVIFATNGQEALEKARTYLPDLIFMDIQMPKLDGLTVIRSLRADPTFATVPIIALTAMAMTGDREHCLEAGATEYLSKPVGLKETAALIRSLLKEKEKATH